MVGTLLGSVCAVVAAPGYFTNGGGGTTTDRFDVSQGARVIHGTNQYYGLGNSDVRQMFGLASSGTWVEPGSAIFMDGPGTGYVDTVDFQTPTAIDLSRIEIRLAQDGANPQRGCSAFRLQGSADGMNFVDLSFGNIPQGATGNINVPLTIQDSAPTNATGKRAFRLELTRLTTAGPRVVEVDGIGIVSAVPAGMFLDRLAFNAATNTYTGLLCCIEK